MPHQGALGTCPNPNAFDNINPLAGEQQLTQEQEDIEAVIQPTSRRSLTEILYRKNSNIKKQNPIKHPRIIASRLFLFPILPMR